MAAVTTTATLTTTSTVCFNTKCNAASSSAWKPGWLMRSGHFADLCDSCGSAYEQLRFCEIFHLDDTGWRICNSCKKRVHCGCIVSLYSFILLDSGGIECIDCAKKSSALNLNLSLIQHLVPLFGYREKFNSLMKELNGNSGTKYPWNNDSGQWLSLPIPWLASTSQTVFPHWSHTPEANTQPANDPVAENSIIEMTSGVDSSKAEDGSNEKVRDGIRTIGNLASSHPMNFEAMTGETCQVEGLQADLIDSDVKELEDISDSKVSKSQDDAVIGNEDICILQNLGLARQNNPAPETDSKDGSYHMMQELQPSCGASLNMSLSVLPSSASKDITEEVNEQSVGPNISVMDTTFGKSADSKENAKPYGLSSIRHRQRQILPKLSQNQPSVHTQTIKGPSPQVPVRVARPPGEGRGRNQLLPRYWPRITDQELQQITSGDSNCTITPLFEKMLSASDAGRIGRLVLPKACAEAYFPPISQPEGLPLKIQDVSGKDWVFQFRFWPNNNSRMYVLEGVTPCIQSMNLQAGDTVTFSRLNPEGKLVMGYRRAPNSLSSQDHPPDVQMNGQSNLSDAENRCDKTEKISAKAKEVSAFQSLAIVDRKRGRHLSSKGKRLRIELEESMDLKLSWEEAQQLLRPPPNAIPTIFTIEGHEFEEYEEPPVFGKRTIFTTRLNSLGEDQWARCDECGNWRRVPSDVFLPTRWICADNVWDPKRATCGMPQEVNSEEIDKILQKTKDAKKSDVVDVQKVAEPPSGLDALATAATLGENNAASSSSPAPTTKHPRHRPGCTCIVCIQPPSGKGPKHKPTCVCNVCMTVKRRFKTLMMRRKKRQSEREAENARKKRAWVKEEEVSSVTKWQTESCGFPEGGLKQTNLAGTFSGPARRANNISPTGQQFSPSAGLSTTFSSIPRSVGDEYLVGKGQIDLNSQPEREDEPGRITGRISMVRLLQSAAYPLDRYLKQQGLTSLICSKQTIPSIGFGRNVGQKKTDDLMGNQSTILNPDRPQEASFFMLGQEKGDTAAFIQPFNDVDRK